MRQLKPAIGIFKVLLFFYMLFIASNVFAQGGTAITIPSIPGRSICDNDFPINAVAVSPAPLLYASSNLNVATISATGVVHIVGIGTTTINAFQAGNPFTASQSLEITSPSPPKVTIAADKTSACAGSPVTFTATISELGVTAAYQWTVNGINAGTNSPTFVTPVIQTDVVQCIVTISNCHVTGASNQITGIKSVPYVSPSISIISSVTFTSNSLANGDNVTCTLTANGADCYAPTSATSNSIAISAASVAIGTVNIVASGNNVRSGTPVTFTASSTLPASKYQWQINGIDAGINSSTFTTRNLKNGDVVTCIALISAACTAPVASNPIVMNILAPPKITVTNTFTPNGDGVNDLWLIPDLSYYPNCLVTIYNRYGILIFQSRGYNHAWDGTYNGRKLPTATYYYVIDLNDITPTPKIGGHITIIR